MGSSLIVEARGFGTAEIAAFNWNEYIQVRIKILTDSYPSTKINIMNNNILFSKFKKVSPLNFWVIGISLIIGLILSILSWLELCVEHCSTTQDYRLFGLPFTLIGITFFCGSLFIHFLSGYYDFLSQWVGWLIASALGAEVMFIAVQKYQIGHWCPVCLSIASCLAIAGLVLTVGYLRNLYLIIQQRNRGNIMHTIQKGLTSTSFFIVGFLLAFMGISKANDVQASVNEIRDRLVFGNKESPVEVYFVTDWFCPACRKVESEIEDILPEIESKAAFYFIDYPIHQDSLNFSPYNLAFLLNNKSDYLTARRLLIKLTQTTKTPVDADIITAAKQVGIQYQELFFVDVKKGTDYFDTVVKKYQLNSTPTMIITNTKTKQVIKMEGRDEMSKIKILKAIEETLNQANS